MPSIYEIEEAYRRTWEAVDKLKKKYKTIYFVRINYGKPISKRVKRTTFAFDYAVANITKNDLKRLEKLIKEWRKQLPNMKILEQIEAIISKYPFVCGYFL